MKTTHIGDFPIANIRVQCFVGIDEQRYLSQKGFMGALGLSDGGGREGVRKIDLLMGQNAISPLISDSLRSRLRNPINLEMVNGKCN
jgi:hypothetical protein